MATTTSNYNLIKPALTDVADITAFNSNWDTIDTNLKKASESGGTPTVTATSTDGVAYTATVSNITELTNGLTITIIPNIPKIRKKMAPIIKVIISKNLSF